MAAFSFPLEQVVGCEHCAAAQSLYTWTCYGCRVRFLARAPKHVRTQAYRELYRFMGPEVMDRVRADVVTCAQAGKEKGAA